MFQEEIDSLINELPTQEEFDRAKELIKSRTLVETQEGRSVSLYLAKHRELDIDSSEELLEKVDAVTREDVQRVAAEYFSKPSHTVIMAPKADLEAHNLTVERD